MPKVTRWEQEKELAIQERLNKPLTFNTVSSKPGKGGGSNSYIETNVAISLANEIFGFNGWNTDIIKLDCVKLEHMGNRWTSIYSCLMKITLADGTYRSDVGVGETSMTTINDAVDLSQKKAVSIAIKRCLRQFGNGLGNCLYNEESRNDIEKKKRLNTMKAKGLVPKTTATPSKPQTPAQPVIEKPVTESKPTVPSIPQEAAKRTFTPISRPTTLPRSTLTSNKKQS